MKFPWVYAVYCLLVVGLYTVARTEGWILFGSSPASRQSGGSGGHGSGVYLGSHK